MKANRRCLALALAVGLFACTRDLSLPKAQVLAAGLACSIDAQCDGNRCSDGVCCLSACAASETCAATGHLGVCTARGLGDACVQDAQCGKGGQCVDGVCCETACTGPCSTCAAPGSKGHCTTQADNHDDRAQCATCFACFGGTCAPALPGTDPANRCSGDLVCSARLSCGTPQGGACVKASDCAVGECLAGVCSVLVREPVSSTEMVPQPTGRTLRSFAATPSGTLAVLYAEYSAEGGDPNLLKTLENDLWLALRTPSGGWKASPLYRDLDAEAGRLPASLISVGEYYYLAATSFTAETNHCLQGTCGLYGLLLAPSGQPGRSEPIDPDVRQVYNVQVLRDGGQIFVFYDGERSGGAPVVHARTGTLTGNVTNWSDVVGFPSIPGIPGMVYTVALVDGAPVLLHLDKPNGTALVASGAGRIEESIDFKDVCVDINQLTAWAVPRPAGESLLLVGVLCGGGRSQFAVLDPRAEPKQRFSAVLLPPGTVSAQPVGVTGDGFALLTAGQYDRDSGVTTLSMRMGLVTASGTTWSNLWEPRGPEDLRDFLAVPLGALPAVVALSGPVSVSSQTFTPPPLTMELIRYQR